MGMERTKVPNICLILELSYEILIWRYAIQQYPSTIINSNDYKEARIERYTKGYANFCLMHWMIDVIALRIDEWYIQCALFAINGVWPHFLQSIDLGDQSLD